MQQNKKKAKAIFSFFKRMAVSRKDVLKTHTSLVDDPTGTVGAIQQVQAHHIHCPTATQIRFTTTVHQYAFTLTLDIIGAGGFP